MTRTPKASFSLQGQFRFTFLLSLGFSVAIAATLLVGLWRLQGLDSAAAQRSIEWQLIIQVVLIAVLAVVGTVIGFTMRARIRGSVKTLTITLGDMEGGDFTNRARQYFRDEIGSLSGQTNQALEYLTEMVVQLREGVTHLEEFSEHSSEGAHDIQSRNLKVSQVSTRLAELARNLENTIDGLNDSGAAVAGDISRLSILSGQNDQLCTEGIAVAQELETAMGSLRAAVERIAQLMADIDKISGQTNMLALNATIEAVRTGQAGRGFQVVANQANDLARQTVEITHVVLTQVDQLQEQAQGASTQIEAMAQRLNQLFAEQRSISASVQDQETALKQSNQYIDTVGRVSGEVGNLAREVTAAVGQAQDESERFLAQMSVLQQSVVDLRADVDRFRV